MTGLLLLVAGAPQDTAAAGGGSAAQDTTASVAEAGVQDTAATVAEVAVQDTAAVVADTGVQDTTASSPEQAVEEAAGTIRDLVRGASSALPKILIALALLVLAGFLASLVKPVLRRVLGSWSRAAAMSAGVGIVIWLLAISAALAIITGDARTLLGSVGLLGLALSWALQAPIESFSAWVLNSFREYYRVGDRIGVGDVFGDVYRIDFLTTTVWEAGGPGKNVQGAQPTGALITFPNSEVLRTNIVNYTRDFPYVWDELAVGVANESDLAAAMNLALETAVRVLGEDMVEPAREYRRRLQSAGLDYEISDRPQVFLEQTDAWSNVIVRYLVAARSRRVVATRLLLELNEAMASSDTAARIIPAYPVLRLQKMDKALPEDGA
jgi:small-conductance mechanosensitive channel